MIAVLGAKMFAAGDTLALSDSRIDADFRPDQVSVTWRDADPAPPAADEQRARQGAEATVEFEDGTVVKSRAPRSYRHPALDDRLRRERTREEARLLRDARRAGVPTPVLRDVDLESATLAMQAVGECDLREDLTAARVRALGRHLATMHQAGFVHGDPTTRNVRVAPEAPDGIACIDFGLGYYSRDPEDHAMDLHVLAQSLAGTADDAEALVEAATEAYREVGESAVLDQLAAIEGRGRYR
jgi:N6-L-threonylcarbamoyladenine synthase/protein kinase Bud32